LRFDPILPNHAIERSAITLTFSEALPDKLFQREMEKYSAAIRKAGLSKSVRPSIGFVVDIKTGNVAREDGAKAPYLFSSADEGTQFTVMPNSVVWVTTAYSRWRPFLSQFLSVAAEVLSLFFDNLELKTVKIECWDRFNWFGNWEEIDYTKLFREGSSYIVPKAIGSEKEWHSHTGWFSYGGAQVRQLTNINIDVVELVSTVDGEKRPSVGIYTMMQDELSGSEGVVLHDRLDNLHLGLKRVFGDIVSDEIKNRVGLGEGEQ
jgi:uncharacterized protein (TIGR04255 family)